MFPQPRKEFYPVPIGQIRRKEYALLNETTYLDHAGTTPYPKSLMKNHCKLMNSNLYGNPHSESPSSLLSTHTIETVRQRMLRFFRADPEYFDLIFVANATAAIKLVADGLRDEDTWCGYHADSHTSLVGLRQLASAGSRCFFSDAEVEEWLSAGADFPGEEKGKDCSKLSGLFAYPAQSNMNGRRLPLDWPARLRKSTSGRVYSLLDAAAYVASAQLDLSDYASAPDFTALSFYKIFGFPDLGALIVRKDTGHVLLNRSYFGGGTVDMVINGTEEAWHATKQGALHEALEDGTPGFHSIAALHCAMDVHTRLYGSMDNVSKHAGSLTAALYKHMSSLTHSNGTPMCTIYKGATADYDDRKTQGPTIAFNVRDILGNWIGKSHFERRANRNAIQLRTGGVCNPGGIAMHLNMSPREMQENYAEGLRCGNDIDEMNGKPTGIIRVSLGAMSNFTDVEVFMRFLETFVDQENDWVDPLDVPVGSRNPDDEEKQAQRFLQNISNNGGHLDGIGSKQRKTRLDGIYNVLRRLICR